jgi:uncharacterized DUF497 family protein
MQFEWDNQKNQLNKRKHGLSFETASFTFQDPFILSVPDDRTHYAEERWQSLGLIQGILIYVAHTIGEDNNGEEIIRIISARAATANEVRRYFANRKDEERA